MESRSGSLLKIWLKRARRVPMDPAETVELDKGQGIRGSANRGGKRQVTVLSADAWRQVESEVGIELDPSLRRANLMVDGIDLENSRGKTLQIGAVRIGILGETRPCRAMNEAQLGLQDALSVHWRGGVFGEVLDDGPIAVGDPVQLIDAVESVETLVGSAVGSTAGSPRDATKSWQQ